MELDLNQPKFVPFEMLFLSNNGFTKRPTSGDLPMHKLFDLLWSHTTTMHPVYSSNNGHDSLPSLDSNQVSPVQGGHKLKPNFCGLDNKILFDFKSNYSNYLR